MAATTAVLRCGIAAASLRVVDQHRTDAVALRRGDGHRVAQVHRVRLPVVHHDRLRRHDERVLHRRAPPHRQLRVQRHVHHPRAAPVVRVVQVQPERAQRVKAEGGGVHGAAVDAGEVDRLPLVGVRRVRDVKDHAVWWRGGAGAGVHAHGLQRVAETGNFELGGVLRRELSDFLRDCGAADGATCGMQTVHIAGRGLRGCDGGTRRQNDDGAGAKGQQRAHRCVCSVAA
mmetsp:Transcript_15791/g.48982  ORF Transcript_15791/g.48982 Transcript_15791/m.48982 type:complete len:230 (+) Transcript_15791:1531-2220(+)